MSNRTSDGEVTFPDAKILISPIQIENEGETIIEPYYIGTVITTNGQIWDVRWNGLSVTEQNIRDLWHTQAELFTKRATNVVE